MLNICRLPDGWWDLFGPTPSSDESGLKGICHDIIGTDGLAFPPDVQEVSVVRVYGMTVLISEQDEQLWLFNDQLCRSIWLEYVEDVKIKGITTKRFTPPNAVFNFSNPDNYCYCPGVRYGESLTNQILLSIDLILTENVQSLLLRVMSGT